MARRRAGWGAPQAGNMSGGFVEVLEVASSAGWTRAGCHPKAGDACGCRSGAT
jgi:hypothetical protein